ncbi:PDZ domain-containing protein [Erythrobacter sp. SDW2]|uniref:PDZ domain-containing protein n=1 Tax=Erythrobacter sp. SDW2 TaxID=2907154 RepID=UPI001F37E5DE|nr:PDZ domain-containing protein [Erythrobacter sp. SDW2]UIP06386.1 PDZ domain-containing protein [Erythrobacter sp. SDW2]
MKRLLAAALMMATMQVAVMAQASEGSVGATEARPSLGLGFWIVEGGIEVNDVASGSPAEKAGLKVGMLITHANGQALTDRSVTEVETLVGAMEGEIVLAVRELGEVRLRKAVFMRTGS